MASTNLLNVSKCKRFIKDVANITRGRKFTRVSNEFLIDCEIQLKNIIKQKIHSHPSVGKTLK